MGNTGKLWMLIWNSFIYKILLFILTFLGTEIQDLYNILEHANYINIMEIWNTIWYNIEIAIKDEDMLINILNMIFILRPIISSSKIWPSLSHQLLNFSARNLHICETIFLLLQIQRNFINVVYLWYKTICPTHEK